MPGLSRTFSSWQESSAFLKRRLREACGILTFLAGLALLAAVAGYDSSDPSWSHAVAGGAANPLGRTGAWIADVLLQSTGAAAVLPGIVLMVWGGRIGAHRSMGRLWLRVVAAPLALLLATVALAALPASVSLPVQTGGFTGQVMLTALEALAQRADVAGTTPFVAAVLAAAAFVAALGVPWSEWRGAARGVLRLGTGTARAGTAGGRKSLRAVRWAGGALRRARPDDDAARPEPTVSAPERAAPDAVSEAVPEPPPEPPPERIVADRRRKPAEGKRAAEMRQPNLDLGNDEYSLPPLDALDPPPEANPESRQNEEALAENARLLESVLEDFGVRGRIVKVRPGPVVTLYELEPAPGTKSARVIGLADDIARSMSAVSVRVAVVPGKNVIGIELPNAVRELVALRELIASKDFENHSGALTLALGKDIGGSTVMVDLARMPHLLIAGTTGSGKSVAVNTMIVSLLYRLPPDRCKLIMIDPKMLELSVYDDIPHLLAPVVTDPAKAVVALRWAVREMEDRYRAMSTMGVRNILGYNQRIADALEKGEAMTRTVQTGFDPETGEPVYEEQECGDAPLPHIVVIVDEMADLMLVAGKEVEGAVQRLAQMARAAGIHLVMATQRPSVDVITGTIKANFPTRISFQVTSKIDSRTILGEGGAEQLLGQGDMLYLAGGGRIRRVHGPFISDEAVERTVAFLRSQAAPDYIEEVTEGEHESPFIPTEGAGGAGGDNSGDALYDQAVAIVCRERKPTTSFVQRQLQIGYNRAARLIERMEAEGIVSKPNHAGKREVLARDADAHEA